MVDPYNPFSVLCQANKHISFYTLVSGTEFADG